MTDERLHDALLAARSVISGSLSDQPGNDWWGVSIARRHLEALAELADEYVSVAARETAEPDVTIRLREATPASRASPPRMTADDVGDYYVYDDGSIWQLVAFSDRPTATLARVNKVWPDGPEQRGGVVGAPIFDGFRKLVPAEPA